MFLRGRVIDKGRKFARYFDVEARIIPVSKKSRFCLDVSKIRENLDENTIGTFHAKATLTRY